MKPTQLKIRVPNGKESPTYTNMTVTDWKKNEIILSFCFAEGDVENPTISVVGKYAMMPENFKAYVQELQQLLESYETKFGEIH